MKRTIIAAFVTAAALACQAAITTVSVTAPSVPTNSTGVTVTNMVSASGRVVGFVVYSRTNATFSIQTTAGKGLSYTARTLASSQGVTNQIVLTNTTYFVDGDIFELTAKLSGDSSATSSVSAKIILEK